MYKKKINVHDDKNLLNKDQTIKQKFVGNDKIIILNLIKIKNV